MRYSPVTESFQELVVTFGHYLVLPDPCRVSDI